MGSRSEIDEFSFKLGELTNAVKESHKKIDGVTKQNGRILDAIKDINLKCVERGKDIQTLENGVAENSESIKAIENNGVSKRTQQKINTGLILSIFNGLVTLIKGMMGWV